MKGQLSDCAKVHRQKWAIIMYKKYPKPKDWHYIYFNDEIYFEYRPKGQLQII